MFYVREIANPLNVLYFGHETGGRYVIPAGFEEVEGALPSGYTLVSVPSISQQLASVLDGAIDGDTPIELRVAVRQLRLAVNDALQAGQLDEALYLIQNPNFEVPEAFEPVQDALVANVQAAIGEP